MNLSRPPAQYDPNDEAQARTAIAQADLNNLKVGQVLDKLQFRDTATGKIVTAVVTSGAFVLS